MTIETTTPAPKTTECPERLDGKHARIVERDEITGNLRTVPRCGCGAEMDPMPSVECHAFPHHGHQYDAEYDTSTGAWSAYETCPCGAKRDLDVPVCSPAAEQILRCLPDVRQVTMERLDIREFERWARRLNDLSSDVLRALSEMEYGPIMQLPPNKGRALYRMNGRIRQILASRREALRP